MVKRIRSKVNGVKNVWKILCSLILWIKGESWSKNVGTSYKLLRRNYLLLTDWRLAWCWLSQQRRKVFSCEQQTREGTRRRFKQEVKVMSEQELFSSTDISRCLNLVAGRNQMEKTGGNCANWPWRIRSRHWRLFPKDSNSASPNPLCDNATIIICHGHYEDALKWETK